MQILSHAKQDCSSERNIGQQTPPLPDSSPAHLSGPSNRDGKRVDASWAVLLAGGDGSRLQSMTTQISGDARPKQFSSIVGDKSLLSQTRDRIRPIFDPRRTLFVVTRKHEHFYLSELSGTPRHNIIEQPVNRGTGVAIAIALLHILEKDQDAVVTFLPCDHYYSDPAAFEDVLSLALRSVPEHPSSIILVGAEPTSPEIEYGWIEPVSNEAERKPRQLQRVSRFWEKPALTTAQELFRNGCLWNTFVTVGRADTFLQVIADEAPDVVLGLTAAFWNGDMETAFSAARTLDFSRDVLCRQADRLLVVADRLSGWTDLGTPKRVIEVLVRNNIHPMWLDGKQESSDQPRAANIHTHAQPSRLETSAVVNDGNIFL